MKTLEKTLAALQRRDQRDAETFAKRKAQRDEQRRLIVEAFNGQIEDDGRFPPGVLRTLALNGLRPEHWKNYRWRSGGLGVTGAKGVYKRPDGTFYVQLVVPSGRGAIREPLFESKDSVDCAAFYDRCARALGCPEECLNFPQS